MAPNPPFRVFDLDGAWARSPVAMGDVDGDGTPDIVVSGTDGIIHAYTGAGSKLWSYDTGNSVIESKAAIGDVDGDGHSEVVVAVGSTYTPGAPGGIWVIDHTGNLEAGWPFLSADIYDSNGVPDGVYSSPALADVDGNDGGKLEIIYGGWDNRIRALNHDGTQSWSQTLYHDTVWSSPAVGDLDRDGRPEIVIGTDTNRNPALGTEDGGMLVALNGEDGSMLPGFPKQIDEVIWSSPALGDLNGDGWLEIVVGTGNCWSVYACAPYHRTHSTTKALYAWDHLGNPLPGWPVPLTAYAFGSPTIGDIDGDGDLEVVVNSHDAYTHAFHANGTPVAGWPTTATVPNGTRYLVWASPILADLTGDGYLEVIVTDAVELIVWDHTGTQLSRRYWVDPTRWTLAPYYSGVWGTPAAGDVDEDGKIELVVASAQIGGYPGAIYVWDFDAAVSTAVSWPAFRRSPANHGRYFAKRPQTPSSIGVSHEYGGSAVEQAALWMINFGDDDIDWLVESLPATTAITPSSGTVGWVGETLTLRISTTGFATGTHMIGSVVITGTVDDEPISGGPVTIPIILRVGPRVFLPLVLRAG